ncbi:MAG: DUF4126 domain-containing protein [Puniceicoccaceae bacterium]
MSIEALSPLMAAAAGIGLAAAAGFRVFLPLLGASLAVRSEILEVGESFTWLGSDAALIFFGVATLTEVLAFFIPWMDNLLDTVASPLAVFAGTILAASVIPGESEWVRWIAGLFLGGGSAGVVQAATVLARGVSTGTTGGVGNPVFAAAESGMSFTMVLVTLVLPLVAAVLVLMMVFWFVSRFVKVIRGRRQRAAEGQ